MNSFGMMGLLGFWSIINSILTTVLISFGIYALIVIIKALKVYINKNL